MNLCDFMNAIFALPFSELGNYARKNVVDV